MLQLPSAIDNFEQIRSSLKERAPVVFLDFDGTLAPIVPTPELAKISPDMRRAVQKLARECPVAIISGRGLEDVESRVDLKPLIYAGSHGFEIQKTDGTLIEKAIEFLPLIDRVESELRLRIGELEGVIIERKRFSIALHYRQVPPHKMPRVKKCVDQILDEYQDIRATGGKKIYDLQPAIDWHKGRAVRWVLENLDPLPDIAPLPIYVGDDLTDEYAFKAIADDGIGVVVQETPGPTAATYQLQDPGGVEKFLNLLIDAIKT